MKITIVIFKAFDQTHSLCFIKEETFWQIHKHLSNICDSYDPLCIYYSDDAEQISLNQLNIFKTPSPCSTTTM